jgi:hypothetical protein
MSQCHLLDRLRPLVADALHQQASREVGLVARLLLMML